MCGCKEYPVLCLHILTASGIEQLKVSDLIILLNYGRLASDSGLGSWETKKKKTSGKVGGGGHNYI